MTAGFVYVGRALAALSLAAQLLGGCSNVPPLLLGGDSSKDAAQGPRVAALVSHFKCELYDAAHSDQVLPVYADGGGMRPKNQPDLDFDHGLQSAGNKPGQKLKGDLDRSRMFTLHNIFREIEYVGDAAFTLDVVRAESVNPNLLLSKYYQGSVAMPITYGMLSVAGQYNDNRHRYVSFELSADFSRLVDTETPDTKFLSAQDPPPKSRSPDSGTPPMRPKIDASIPPQCPAGSELSGNLGLKETLATGLIAAAMNNISAFPTDGSSGGNINVSGVAPVISVPSSYTFGQITSQIDFTVLQDFNFGPAWVLRWFQGKGGNNGFFDWQRTVKDTLLVTFVPVCIRSQYWTNDTGSRRAYYPEMVDGTPAWANFLPPCSSPDNLQARLLAVSRAHDYNVQTLLQSSIGIR